jgi:hypothetical protein
LQHGDLALPQQEQSVEVKNRIMEQCFHPPDQNPSEAQHLGKNFTPMETPWSGHKFLVGLVGLPSSVPVVWFDGDGRATSGLF